MPGSRAPASSAARCTAITAATAASIRRVSSFAPWPAGRRGLPRGGPLADVAGQPRVARVGQLLVDDGFVVRQAGRQRPVGVRLLLQVLGLLLGDGEVRWGLGGWCGSPV